jgi:hypothetical protein
MPTYRPDWRWLFERRTRPPIDRIPKPEHDPLIIAKVAEERRLNLERYDQVMQNLNARMEEIRKRRSGA